jgi:hypothetical protein
MHPVKEGYLFYDPFQGFFPLALGSFSLSFRGLRVRGGVA